AAVAGLGFVVQTAEAGQTPKPGSVVVQPQFPPPYPYPNPGPFPPGPLPYPYPYPQPIPYPQPPRQDTDYVVYVKNPYTYQWQFYGKYETYYQARQAEIFLERQGRIAKIVPVFGGFGW
ncbi:MAG TPA: hypothetical protein VKE74_22310, partial [Gemmataceae bacterium]|nr:hypothetical protein [Gemmataceae bacterium]